MVLVESAVLGVDDYDERRVWEEQGWRRGIRCPYRTEKLVTQSEVTEFDPF